MHRHPFHLSILGLALMLGACERRPADPPKPATLADATPATAGLASLSGPSTAKPPNGPASDPPPTPIPPPQPPSQPASAASLVAR